MENKLIDEFKLGEIYVVYTSDGATTTGVLVSKSQVFSEGKPTDMIGIHSDNMEETKFIVVTDIMSYSWFTYDDEAKTMVSKIYNVNLSPLGIERGDTTTKILSKITENWNEYDDKKRDFIVGELLDSFARKDIVDLITALVQSKDALNEQSQDYIRLFKDYGTLVNNYEEFRSSLGDGQKVVYDAFVYDVLKLNKNYTEMVKDNGNI